MMLPHHIKLDVCEERPKYRQGRKLTAVKVYTVADESAYLLISGVPKLDLLAELHAACSEYGVVSQMTRLDEYPSEQFTDTYLVKYSDISSSRYAKRRIDDLNFYGGVLHVCYAPEYESTDETRAKLLERRITIARKCKSADSSKFEESTRSDLSKGTLKIDEKQPPSSVCGLQSGLSNQFDQGSLPWVSSYGDTLQVFPVELSGIDNVTSENIDHVSIINPVAGTDVKSCTKKRHFAADAALWSSVTFNSIEQEELISKRMKTQEEPESHFTSQKSNSFCHEKSSSNKTNSLLGQVFQQPDLSVKPLVVITKPTNAGPNKFNYSTGFVPRQVSNQQKSYS